MSELEFSDKHPVSHDESQFYLAFATETARAAGIATLPFFRADVGIENKLSDGKFDPVTQADKAAELVVREAIGERFPEHGILGEEFGYKPGNGLTWIIDPIDGTRAFMSGMLHWGVLVGLFDGLDMVCGAMYQPYTDEMFSGDGETAFLLHSGSERKLANSGVERISDAVLACTGPDWFSQSQLVQFENVSAAVKMRRFGGDCYLFAMLATGYVDVAMEAELNPYDIAALVPIIRGAGGVVTTYDGGNPCLGGPVVASATERLHAQVLATINQP